SRRRHTISKRDWSSDVCSSDLTENMKEQLFIFDKKDNLLTVTKNYITAPFKETVDQPVSLTIEFPVSDDDSEYLVGGNQVAFRRSEERRVGTGIRLDWK